MTQPRLVVGVSGASGMIYAQRLLLAAKAAGCETHLVVSRAARMTLAYELGEGVSLDGADHTYGIQDVGAPIASGSFKTLGMVVVPCSVRTLSEIATGVTSSLLTRAADVCLKDRRRLVLMVRETPFHLGHLRSMTAVTEMGGIIAPPLPAFYAEPSSIEEMVDQSVGRILDLFGLDAPEVKRWGEDLEKGRRP
jgi:4-hydroxy-3-polyprenylbenzoate decarboxylase